MKTIFIVDDCETNLMAAKTALSAVSGYKSFAMPSAARMFHLAEKITPDLILLDVDMPEMDGFEAMRMMKSIEKLQAVPVVFLTAKNDAESEKRGLDLGALDFVYKPFSSPQLITKLETLFKSAGNI